MSVNRDMRDYELLKANKTRSTSGAEKEDLEKVRDISVAVYKTSDMISAGSAKYKESTHVGMTHFKDIKAGTFHIRNEDHKFEIISFNPDGRLAVLLLKEVDSDA